MLRPLLDNAYRKAHKIVLSKDDKLVFMSDLHKGDNSYADDFKKNMRIYRSALHHYYLNDFIYVELGDGIELWENRKIKPIIRAHSEIFDMLKEFSARKKLYLVYGNHDMIMQIPFMAKRLLGKVIPGIAYHESVLVLTPDKVELLAMHGHQADYLNYLFWWFFRFMVRYIWKPLQLLGIHDPTSPAKNYKTLIKVEKRLSEWIAARQIPVVFGHTHRPRFPLPGEIPMFNSGSAVHPESVTAIEWENNRISLVKWTEKEDSGEIVKSLIAGPESLKSYIQKWNKKP